MPSAAGKTALLSQMSDCIVEDDQLQVHKLFKQNKNTESSKS